MSNHETDATPLVGADSIGAASCLTTLLALPLMLGTIVVIEWLLDPVPVAAADAVEWLVGLPLLFLLGVLGGVSIWPWSCGAALLFTFAATIIITRRNDGAAKWAARSWLIAGFTIGAIVAVTMFFESPPIATEFRLATVISGPLTGMAAMLICRHLVRRFEG